MTLPEVLLWRGLRQARALGAPIRRQHPFGPYVLDFYCPRARLCIEVDGGAHGFGDQPGRDRRRDGYLKAQGVRVMRLAASEVLDDPSGIIDAVLAIVARNAAAAPPPPFGSPSPASGGGFEATRSDPPPSTGEGDREAVEGALPPHGVGPGLPLSSGAGSYSNVRRV